MGALAYTWGDTFWFSAVEGEVYAYSSLFTAVVFWLILKWESVANEPHSDRWLVLIAYLTGLSIGVHLLNLLCIPAIVLVYYYKKNPDANLKGSLLALTGSMVLVAAVLYGIVPGVVKVGGWFELLFVNSFGMPFNSGLIVYIILLAASIIWGVYESYTEKSRKRMNISFMVTIAMLGIPFYGYGWSSALIGIIILGILGVYLFADLNKKYQISARTLNTSLLCIMMIMVGYSSYALIVIRSTANTPMDQNSPEDIFTLGEYLGREQYGTRPLFYGQTYASKPALKEVDGGCVYDVTEGAPVYQRKEKATPDEKDSYEVVRHKTDYKYAQNMLFPRMYSDAHAQAYEDWLGGIKGVQVPYDQCGQMVMVKVPTQWDNIKFFFIYQLNYMYWRYFMWNFAGRQNDIQGQGEIEHGNWITGIPFVDKFLVGDQSLLPSDLKDGKYELTVTTQYSGRTLLKEPRSASVEVHVGEAVEVAATVRRSNSITLYKPEILLIIYCLTKKQTNMNVKSLMLLLAFAGLGASCSDDETNGGDTSGIAGRSELQIVFSGTGESQEYTKATASEGENKIDKLQVYLFASATGQAGSYYYMETWDEGTAFDSEDKDASGNPKTNFKKQDAGTGWKASIYPNELKGCLTSNSFASQTTELSTHKVMPRPTGNFTRKTVRQKPHGTVPWLLHYGR